MSPPAVPYDLALGGSGSVGFQPTLTDPRGRPSDDGYTNDLARRESPRWPGLTLVHLGCPGITTQEMLAGGTHCQYPSGSELAEAVAFLHTHPSTVLITVDLGFNDLLPCMRDMVVTTTCTSAALADLRVQMAQILGTLRAAAPARAQIIGVGHYDPYLGDAVRGAAGQAFAAASLHVIEQLDGVLRASYTAAGLRMADVFGAFESNDTAPVAVPGRGTLPENVARVCALTWMCMPPPLGPNSHPNDVGYRVIGGALAATLDSALASAKPG